MYTGRPEKYRLVHKTKVSFKHFVILHHTYRIFYRALLIKVSKRGTPIAFLRQSMVHVLSE